MTAPALNPEKPSGFHPEEDAFLRALLLKSFTEQLPAFVRTVYWPADRVRTVRERRLRRLIGLAKAQSPWHARRLAHVDPASLTEADIGRLPVMTKSDLMANFDEIVTDRSIRLTEVEKHLATLEGDAYFAGTKHAVCSGGSSGRRGCFVFDWSGWVSYGLSSARPIALMLSATPPRVRDVGVAIIADSAAHSSAVFAQSFGSWITSQFTQFARISASLPFATLIERLNELQPTCLFVYPSLLQQIWLAAEAGQLNVRPAAILVGGEPLYPAQKAAFERTFGAQLFDFYGCSEASCLGFSCSQGQGLHLCDDTVILEPQDKNGLCPRPGTGSERVLLTNLFSTLVPLIRYEVEDSIVIAEDQGLCVCGSSFQKIEAVEGRVDDVFQYGNGVIVHPLLFDSTLGQEASISEYQIRQTRLGADVLVVASVPIDVQGIAEKLEAMLRDQGLRSPHAAVVQTDKIERTGVGKMRRFIGSDSAS